MISGYCHTMPSQGWECPKWSTFCVSTGSLTKTDTGKTTITWCKIAQSYLSMIEKVGLFLRIGLFLKVSNSTGFNEIRENQRADCKGCSRHQIWVGRLIYRIYPGFLSAQMSSQIWIVPSTRPWISLRHHSSRTNKGTRWGNIPPHHKCATEVRVKRKCSSTSSHGHWRSIQTAISCMFPTTLTLQWSRRQP